MVNPSKIKGTAWETAVVRYLQSQGFDAAERRALAGSGDKGDIAGLRGCVIECKAERKHDLAGWVAEAVTEKANADAALAVVFAKRRNHSVGHGYAIHEIEDYTWMLSKLYGKGILL